MKLQIKKLLKIFLLVSLVIIFVLTTTWGVYRIEEINKTIIEKEAIIEVLNSEVELYKNNIEESNIKLKKMAEEYENMIKKYEEIEKKYLEEITPVSFNPNNLWSSSNATIYDMEKALQGTGLESVAYAYVKAEKEWGVNALFLASLTAEESGWGNSHRARTQNNLSGFAVYSATAEGTTFSSKEESIMATAELICDSYLKPTGKYHNGISISSVNKLYCPNDGGNWSENISSITYSLVDKINNS